MKACYIPISVLVLLLVLSLWSGGYLQSRTDSWREEITAMTDALEDEAWQELESRIFALHEDWGRSQSLFHLLLAHEDLDEAEKYFVGALAACQEQDTVELRILLAQLASQMTYLADTQEVTLKNIL